MNRLLAAVLDFLKARDGDGADKLLVAELGRAERLGRGNVERLRTRIEHDGGVLGVLKFLNDRTTSGGLLVALLVDLLQKRIVVGDIVG